MAEQILLRDPINRKHPLAQGLSFAYLCLPSLTGGATWHDLTGNFPATLKNSPTIAGSGRPGGIGKITFNGSNQNALPTGSFPTGKSGYTVSAWIKVSATSCIFDSAHSVFGQSGFTLFTNQLIVMSPSFTGYLTTSNLTAQDGSWHHITGRWDGVNLSFWVDGVKLQTLAGPSSLISQSVYTIGAYGNGTGAFAGWFNGSMDCLFGWQRALSDSEIFLHYEFSKRGFPKLLNRQRFTPAGGGASNLAGTTTIAITSSLAATGSLSIAGTTTIALNSSLTASGVLAIAGTTSLSSDSSLTASGVLAIAGTTAISVSGSLTATGSLTVQGQTTIAATGSLSASGVLAIAGTTNLSIGGSLSATGLLAIQGQTTISIIGALTAAGFLAIQGMTTIALNGSLSPLGVLAIAGTTNLSIGSSASATGLLAIQGQMTIAIIGALTAIGVLIVSGQVNTYANILVAIVNQLVTTTGLDSTAVGLSLTREPSSHVTANQYITITPGKEVPIDGQVIGVGRWGSGMTSTVYINCYYRSALDLAYQDYYIVAGLRDLIYQVTDGLQLFFPMLNQVLLTEEPIRVLGNAPTIKPKRSKEWSWTSIPYEVRYSKPCNTMVVF